MKILLLTAIIATLSLKSLGQDWGDWIDMGHEVQVSFKFSTKGCNGYSYARIRNVSDKNKFCRVRISFSLVCSNSVDPHGSVSAYNIGPGEISQLQGNWYNTERVSNLKLTNLENNECKDILNAVHTNGGVNEISYPGKNLGAEYQKKLDSLREEDKKKDKERNEKYEKEKKEIDKQAERERQKQAKIESTAQKKTESIVSSNPPTYPNTEEARLRRKINDDNNKNVALQQSLNQAIDATRNLIQNVIAAKRENDKIKEEKYQKSIAEDDERIARAEMSESDGSIGKMFTYMIEHYSSKNRYSTYAIYKGYSTFITKENEEETREERLYNSMDIFFMDTANRSISPFEFSQFLYVLTWEDGKMIDLLRTNRFHAYLTNKKDIAFANYIQSCLETIVADIESISKKKFTAIFQPLAFSFSAFKKFKYSQVDFPISLDKTSSRLNIPVDIPLFRISYNVATKYSKNKPPLNPTSGTITATVIRVNKFAVTEVNSIFSLCPDRKNEDRVQEDHTSRYQAGPGDSNSCLVKINADIAYTSSFNSHVYKNVNIYFWKANKRTGYGAPEDFYSGFIDDYTATDNNLDLLRNYLSYSDKTDKYLRSPDVIRRFLTEGHCECGDIYEMHGLSMLLITEVGKNGVFFSPDKYIKDGY